MYRTQKYHFIKTNKSISSDNDCFYVTIEQSKTFPANPQTYANNLFLIMRILLHAGFSNYMQLNAVMCN